MSEACSQRKGWNAEAKRQHSPGLWAEPVTGVTFLVETLLISVSPGHSFLCYESSLRICNKHIIVKKLKAMISCSANTCQWNNSEHKTQALKELTSIIKPVLQEKKLVQRGEKLSKVIQSVRGSGLLPCTTRLTSWPPVAQDTGGPPVNSHRRSLLPNVKMPWPF